jgi:hypothetical protein
MECKPRHNTVDAATLFWAGIPGNAGDFPAEESFYTFIEPAFVFLPGDKLSGFTFAIWDQACR